MSSSGIAHEREIGIGLLGLGSVGSAVAQVLTAKREALAQRLGFPFTIRKALVRDPNKIRVFSLPPRAITTRPEDVLEDPNIQIVIEVLGGETPAHELIRGALARDKNVVTANKVVIGQHGSDLVRLAQDHGVSLLYEASVGGGIPLVGVLRHDLAADEIQGITAIINGTTNYILSRMSQEGLPFSTALSAAQELGYAEPDPTEDLEGTDAAHKLAIMATLAFHTEVHSADIYREGISRLTPADFQYALELGYAIKLLAIAKKSGELVQARVHPTFIPQDLLLAKVDGVFNAVQIDSDIAGRLLLYGRGAGPTPTASAVISDVVNIAREIVNGRRNGGALSSSTPKPLQPMAEIESKYYIRMTVDDTYGVFAQIGEALANQQISLASVIQKRVYEHNQTAEIVLMSHPTKERGMQAAVSTLEKMAVVKEIGNLIRVEA